MCTNTLYSFYTLGNTLRPFQPTCLSLMSEFPTATVAPSRLLRVCCARVKMQQLRCRLIILAHYVILAIPLVFHYSNRFWHWHFPILCGLPERELDCAIYHERGAYKLKITDCYDFTTCEIITILEWLCTVALSL